MYEILGKDTLEREKLVATAESRTFRATRPMAEIFGVSTLAIAYRLIEPRLVT